MKDLYLPLKNEWFQLIRKGVKPVEYKEITPYWAKRLLEPTNKFPKGHKWQDFYGDWSDYQSLYRNIVIGLVRGFIRYRTFTNTHFTLGYPSKDEAERHMIYPWIKTDIGTANHDWAHNNYLEKKFFRIWFNNQK